MRLKLNNTGNLHTTQH